MRNLLIVAVVAALAAPALANHNASHTPYPACVGTVTVIGDGVSTTTLYIADRPSPGSPNGLVEGDGTWFYKESGVAPGLQVGGNSVLIGPLDPEICRHPVRAEWDILIW